MMTLEEAIEHCKKEAEHQRRNVQMYEHVGLNHAASWCNECAAEHEQLAEWLIELKKRREAENSKKQKTNGDRIRKMTDSQISKTLMFVDICSMCTGADSVYCGEPDYCKHSIEEWLKQEDGND